jgi:hypothetical protein
MALLEMIQLAQDAFVLCPPDPIKSIAEKLYYRDGSTIDKPQISQK